MARTATMHRTIFLSDFHLGSRLAKADHLLDFIEHNDAATWYLLGDIYDIKRLRRRHYWPTSHARVIRALRRKARAGAKIIYVPGNHDPELRQRTGVRPYLPSFEVRCQAIHTTADGRRLLVVHGDEYEPELESRRLSYWSGCAAYFIGAGASELVGQSRAALGFGYWSLAAALKDRVLPRVPLITRYRENLRRAARQNGVDGVVCGHIHHAAAELSDGILYLNCGDWVDSCTALVEDWSGGLGLLHWPGTHGRLRSTTPEFKPEPVPA